MLFQPTNMTPSNFVGEGEGVIDADKQNIFSMQLNGNSKCVAYKITIMKNDTNSTVIYDGAKTTVDLYPVDYQGQAQYLESTIPSSSGMINGENYKWIVKLWWGSTDTESVVSNEVGFVTIVTPQLEIDNTATTVNKRNITLTATYTQPNSQGIKYFQWTLARKRGNIRDILKQTDLIYGSDLKFVYNILENDKNYSAQILVQNNEGQTTLSPWYDFAVHYDAPEVSGYLNVKRNIYSGIEVSWNKLNFIEGSTAGGAISYLDNTPVANSVSVKMPDNTSIIKFESTVDAPFDINNGSNYIWTGKLGNGFDGRIFDVETTENTLLEAKYNATNKRFEIYVNGSMVTYQLMDNIEGKWFNIYATSSSLTVAFLKDENPVANFDVLCRADQGNDNLILETKNLLGQGYVKSTPNQTFVPITSNNIIPLTQPNNNIILSNDVYTYMKIKSQYYTSFFDNLNLSKMTKIKEFILDGKIGANKNLDISNCMDLENLDVSNNSDMTEGINSIIKHPTATYDKLTKLDLDNNNISNKLILDKFTTLKEVNLSQNNLEEVSIASPNNLEKFYLSNPNGMDTKINPILNKQANLRAVAELLPNRTGSTKGEFPIYPAPREWVKDLCDGKNWDTYAVATMNVTIPYFYSPDNDSYKVNLPLEAFDGTVSYVDWGDGSPIEKTPILSYAHKYPAEYYRSYTIKIYLNNIKKLGNTRYGVEKKRYTINSINLSELTNMKELLLWWQGTMEGVNLDISKLVNLTTISLDSCELGSLYLGNTIYTKMTGMFDIDENPNIGNINFNQFPNLSSSILIANTNCTKLDVSPCPNINYIRLFNNPILNSQTEMINFANSLPSRVGKSQGTIQLSNATAISWINDIATSKNWNVR